MKYIKERFDKFAIVFSSIGLAFAVYMLFALIDKGNQIASEILYLTLLIVGLLLAASLVLFVSALQKKLNKKVLATSAFLTLSSCAIVTLTDVVSNHGLTFALTFQLAIAIGLIVTYAISLTKEKLKLPVLILAIIEVIMFIPTLLVVSSIHVSLAVLMLFIIISLLIKEEK